MQCGPSFAAIEAYLDRAYMELLPRAGAEVRARVAAELAAAVPQTG